MSDNRVEGRVHILAPTYAIIEGDNGIHYFTMPTDVRPPNVFRDLVRGDEPKGILSTRVSGEPYLHKGRQRMRDVVVTPANASVSHGETA